MFYHHFNIYTNNTINKIFCSDALKALSPFYTDSALFFVDKKANKIHQLPNF